MQNKPKKTTKTTHFIEIQIQIHCNITLLSHPQIAYNLIEAGEGWKDKFKM